MIHEKDLVDFKTGEVKRVNANFVQLYDDNLDLIMLMTKENPTALSIFLWIVKYMDSRNALVASQQAIAESLGLHKNTVYLAIKYLKEKSALTVLRSSNTHIFALNAQIVWRDSAESKKFAHFDAKVYVSESEQQEEEIKPLFDTQLVGHLKPKRSVKTRVAKQNKSLAKAEAGTAEEQPRQD
ncbi:MAG: helix-turn-helix domain-containing protein [Rickettsiaceae bacterium]|nr:MAG: helix-turn-helix domain-containing protein [Rickettsiaceae bacterium]